MQKPTINVYGSFRALDSNGNQVELASTKSRHIFTALILAYPEPVQRDLLCRMMWPDSSDESRKTRLRQELGILREFATRLQREDLLVVDRGLLSLNIEGIQVDCIESRQLYAAYASTLPLSERIENLNEQIRILGRGQIAPDTQSLFESERKRASSRLTTARIELTKLYIDTGRLPEARKVLDAVLDLHPDNEAAKALHARLLDEPVQVRLQEPSKPTEIPLQQPKRTLRSWYEGTSWTVRIAIAAVTTALLVTFFIPPKTILVAPTPKTLVSTPPIAKLIGYQHTPGPGELDDSEFIGLARLQDGSVAITGIVKTKTEDVDGIVTLLGPDLQPKWTRRVTGPSHDADRLESIQFDASKNIFAAGETYSVNQPKTSDGWYGSIVSYDVNGKLRFQGRTRRKIVHGSEVKRRVIADQRGGAWYCSSTAENGKDQIFATHFDGTGKIINDIVISGVQAKLLSFSRHTQDEYCVVANAKSSASSTTGDWFLASFTNDGRILWTSKMDGPAKADDFITSESLSAEGEYHFIGGLMTSSKSPSDVARLSPTVATINVHTGTVGRQIALSSDIPNASVSLFDMSRRDELDVAIQESTVDSRTPIILNIMDKVTGAMKQTGTVTLPDGQYLTHVRRFVSNPKTGTLQLITNTARDIGTSQSQAIVVTTIKPSGETTHEIYKNLDRVTVNVINQIYGVGQVDMGGRWPATLFTLPYPD